MPATKLPCDVYSSPAAREYPDLIVVMRGQGWLTADQARQLLDGKRGRGQFGKVLRRLWRRGVLRREPIGNGCFLWRVDDAGDELEVPAE